MIKKNNTTNISPRYAGAFFFAVYALMFLIFTKYTLLSLKDSQGIPLGFAFVIVPLIGGVVGSLFGPKLAQNSPWWKPVIWGLLLAISALLLVSTAVFINSFLHDPQFFQRLSHWTDYFILYGLILATVTLIIGLWLIPFTCVVALYFNKRFYPGLIAVDALRQQQRNNSKKDD